MTGLGFLLCVVVYNGNFMVTVLWILLAASHLDLHQRRI